MKILSNAPENILLKGHLLSSYDFGSVKFIIMKFIWFRGFNLLVHVIFQIYLISIFVVKGSRPSNDSKFTEKRDKWDFPLRLEWGCISAWSKND